MQTLSGMIMSIWYLILIGCSQGGITKAFSSLVGSATSVAKAAQWIGINPARGSYWGACNTWQTLVDNQALYFTAIIAGIAGFGTLCALYTRCKDTDFKSYRCRSGEGVQKQHLQRLKKFSHGYKTVSRNGPTMAPQVPKNRNSLQCLSQVQNLPRTKCLVFPMSTQLYRAGNWARLLQ